MPLIPIPNRAGKGDRSIWKAAAHNASEKSPMHDDAFRKSQNLSFLNILRLHATVKDIISGSGVRPSKRTKEERARRIFRARAVLHSETLATALLKKEVFNVRERCSCPMLFI